ncbi:hypothetical protein QR685DRAFT_571609 [Neurospora intermedia]|uniref:Secreted protein n=1 Tax=Neurospora intermedia TaxID=5142 RepID=A0ABR3DCU3_NEUIN
MGISALLYLTAIFAATLIAGYQSSCAKELCSTVHNWHPGSTTDWGRPLKMGSVHHRVRRDGNREQHGTSSVFVPVSGNDFTLDLLRIGQSSERTRKFAGFFKKTSCCCC